MQRPTNSFRPIAAMVAVLALSGCAAQSVPLPAAPNPTIQHLGMTCDGLHAELAQYHERAFLYDERRRNEADENACHNLGEARLACRRERQQARVDRLESRLLHEQKTFPDLPDNHERTSIKKAIERSIEREKTAFQTPSRSDQTSANPHRTVTAGQRIHFGSAARRISSGGGEKLQRDLLLAIIPFGGVANMRAGGKISGRDNIIEQMLRQDCENTPTTHTQFQFQDGMHNPGNDQ